jgi:predicted DNA-binding transcriptional regulator YafY
MYKAERLFQLAVLLRRSRTITARELAGELGVSERTIYRDVFNPSSFPGCPWKARRAWAISCAGTLICRPLMFTNEEAQALLLGARMVQAWGDPSLERAARGVLDKVRAVSDRSLLENLDSQLMQVPGFHIAPSLREKMGLVREGMASSGNYSLTTPGPTASRPSGPCGPWAFFSGGAHGPLRPGASCGRPFGIFAWTGWRRWW